MTAVIPKIIDNIGKLVNKLSSSSKMPVPEFPMSVYNYNFRVEQATKKLTKKYSNIPEKYHKLIVESVFSLESQAEGYTPIEKALFQWYELTADKLTPKALEMISENPQFWLHFEFCHRNRGYTPLSDRPAMYENN